jgi:hypothetical protein
MSIVLGMSITLLQLVALCDVSSHELTQGQVADSIGDYLSRVSNKRMS